MKTTARDFSLELNENPIPEVAERINWYQEKFNTVPNLGRLLESAPATLLSYVDTQNYLAEFGTLSPEENNIVQMTIAVENACAYCAGGHTFAGEVLFNSNPDDLNEIINKQKLSNEKFNVLHEFTKDVYNKKGRVSDASLQNFFDAGYTKPQALDVITNIAAKVLSNFANQLAINIPDEMFAEISNNLNYDTNYR
ncbi:hypothetical protein [uncultured Aquimarina sp.]|uniref:carboxymuconolactone decarboxylase family protein n=1 Tax=uncultured Aquimarina sp. TaxID=575652 RepID=UPI002612796E|nr:hypothetical protein [uncultured Aquimarina sp.]